jgi:sigma-B regulation protein RsbU (phosphoserine phosphatase)
LVSGATGPKPKHRSLVASGQRLGEAREVHEFEEKTVPLTEGDILFLYTDGLMEGRDLSGEMYGKKRTRKVVDSLVSKGPDALIAGLVKEFKAHNQGKDYDDDITLAAVRLLKFMSGPGTAGAVR